MKLFDFYKILLISHYVSLSRVNLQKQNNENLPELDGTHSVAGTRLICYQSTRHRLGSVVETTFLLLKFVPQCKSTIFIIQTNKKLREKESQIKGISILTRGSEMSEDSGIDGSRPN